MNNKYFCLVTLLFLISGCTNAVPKCSDRETTDLVIEIADDEMTKQLGADASSLFSYSVRTIRTTNTNEKTGAHKCAAQLEITSTKTDAANEIPITYTVELTDDGTEFYVNVYGL